MSSKNPGSFRDPSGFIFESSGRLYRQVNQAFAAEFESFTASGLYDALVREKLLVSHVEHPLSAVASPDPARAWKIIEPERIGFISYPYEWSFSQLKDAALATLSVQKLALEHNHVLRDASAFNMQFHNGHPIFIDTLSFEPWREGEPWVAYRQFCQHFLAPLALAAYSDIRLISLGRQFIDGVPLDLASRLLPVRTRFNPALSLHVHLHARSQRRYAATSTVRRRPVGMLALRGLVDSLAGAVRRLKWRPMGTEWGDYYDATNYTGAAVESKPRIVADFIRTVSPRSVWDLGANTGVFSRLASDAGIPTVAFDVDPAAVEKNYLETKRRQETRLLPLVMDLTNPTPSLGWEHRERDSLLARGPADLVLALALIHHLAISNNVPLARVAQFLAGAGRNLIIEFVPKDDSQVRRLLSTRTDIFPDYDEAGFESAFSDVFDIVESRPVEASQRRIYLMRSKDS